MFCNILVSRKYLLLHFKVVKFFYYFCNKANVKKMKPLILLSNDDGVTAKGLKVLIETLHSIGDVFVVAPDRARSGSSCCITSPLPITIKRLCVEEGLTIYSCTGTPSDCVKIALDQLLMRQPDLVIGGINHGSNASINEIYSGTMGVAKEAVLHGIPSIAFSLCNHDDDADFDPLCKFVQHITELVLEKGLPYGSCLNVNFPPVEEFSGVKICRMAYGRWENEYTPCERPQGGRYYWLGGECVNDEPEDDDTDSWALDRDFVSITPIKIDATDYELKEKLSNWGLEDV